MLNHVSQQNSNSTSSSNYASEWFRGESDFTQQPMLGGYSIPSPPREVSDEPLNNTEDAEEEALRLLEEVDKLETGKISDIKTEIPDADPEQYEIYYDDFLSYPENGPVPEWYQKQLNNLEKYSSGKELHMNRSTGTSSKKEDVCKDKSSNSQYNSQKNKDEVRKVRSTTSDLSERHQNKMDGKDKEKSLIIDMPSEEFGIDEEDLWSMATPKRVPPTSSQKEDSTCSLDEIRSLTSKSLVNPEYEEITDSSISEISSDIGGQSQTEQHHKSDDSTRGGSSCERDYHDCSIVVVTSKNKEKSKGSNVTDDSCVDMSISSASSNANQLYYDADDEHTAFGDNETFCAYDNFDILPNIVAGYDESSCTFDQNPVSKNYLIQSYDPRFYEDPDIFGHSGNNDPQSFNPDYDEPAKRYLLNSCDSRFCCDDPNTSTFNICEHSEVGCKYRKDPPAEHAHVNCEELMMVHSETDTVINSKSSANCEFPDFIIETVNETSSSYHRSSLSSPRRRSPEHRYFARDRWNSPSSRRRRIVQQLQRVLNGKFQVQGEIHRIDYLPQHALNEKFQVHLLQRAKFGKLQLHGDIRSVYHLHLLAMDGILRVPDGNHYIDHLHQNNFYLAVFLQSLIKPLH
ncbi:unnamed protein product [Trichogramma brassicae]|uniref:Uncharacterized protein n=1 Tax=Trichogramma brassicae TaxID=86971 RepID=A0A6H5IQK0_9HYME|nr:unnamed protein product [Trichogramma brassicae]